MVLVLFLSQKIANQIDVLWYIVTRSNELTFSEVYLEQLNMGITLHQL